MKVQTPNVFPLSSDFSRLLLDWYDQNKRDLPWRTSPTPYAVWVSEIMLQQTRVEAVKPYFARFMQALPDIAALAACPPDELAKLWEGLGYYSRARNLKRAAEIVVEEHGGELPRDPAALRALPGIGAYTAGAIASIAYGVPAPAVDGNVLRVLARVLGDERNILDERVKRDYEATLAPVIDPARPGDFCQAMIELGATVCGPNQPPACDECPLCSLCRAHKEGFTEVLPVREKKKPRRKEQKTVLLLADGSHLLLHRRPEGGLLGGLYELPSLQGNASEAEILAYARSLGLEPIRLKPAGQAKHIFTHIEWHMTVYEVALGDTALPPDTPLRAVLHGSSLTPDASGDFVFATTEALESRYAIPSAFAKLLPAGTGRNSKRRRK